MSKRRQQVGRIAGETVTVAQDMDLAINVLRSASAWLEESGKHPSKWWQLTNMNREFLLQYAEPSDFYVALVNGFPAGAEVLQFEQNSQDWSGMGGVESERALYISWFCVHRKFAGKNLSITLMDFAAQLARDQSVELLRLDTNADELKLRRLYETLGFNLIAIRQEDYRRTAFYQKRI